MNWLRARPASIRIIVPVVAAAVVAGAVGVALWSNASTAQASATYQQRRAALQAQLKQAEQQGYTSADLAPITSQLRSLDRDREPWWMPGRPMFYGGQAAAVTRLERQLLALEQRLSRQARADAGGRVDAARSQIAQAQQATAASSDVQALQQRLDAAARAQGAAHTLGAYRSAAQQAGSVLADAAALRQEAERENQAVQQAAQQLVGQTGGDLGAIQRAGQQALSGGRNDASIAAYMSRGNMVKGYDAIRRAYDRLEVFGAVLGSGDVNQAARGAAGAQRYAGQVHDALVAGLPARAMVVSFEAQHVWSYENGQVVMDTPVTTGVRGVTDYGTDFGPMKVLRAAHPWTFKSPWPKGSPYWYPDTPVQYSTFFTSTGESFHDADWEPDSRLGPGSQYDPSTRSHGCIHVPLVRAQWIYGWAQVGTAVIVYPGDGSPVANQLSLITTNDQGVPDSAG